jgi:hypothetical protein
LFLSRAAFIIETGAAAPLKNNLRKAPKTETATGTTR